MSRRNREYKDVVQKLVGRQSTAARGSPDHQRRLQQRQLLQKLRQHVSEARYETGEAVSHIQEEMYKMEARLDRSGSLESEEGAALPTVSEEQQHAGASTSGNAAGICSQSSLDKYQSDTLRAMQELMLKRQQSDQDQDHDHDDHDDYHHPEGAGHPHREDEHSAHSIKDTHMT